VVVGGVGGGGVGYAATRGGSCGRCAVRRRGSSGSARAGVLFPAAAGLRGLDLGLGGLVGPWPRIWWWQAHRSTVWRRSHRSSA
jgi:hypothetical protein